MEKLLPGSHLRSPKGWRVRQINSETNPSCVGCLENGPLPVTEHSADGVSWSALVPTMCENPSEPSQCSWGLVVLSGRGRPSCDLPPCPGSP